MAQRTEKILFTIIFLVAIGAGTCDYLFHLIPPAKITRDTELAGKPVLGQSGFFAYLDQFANYFNDRFPLRNRWVIWNNFLKVRGLGVSPIPRILLGKKGWMFLAREADNRNQIDYYRNVKPFSEEELAVWKNFLEQRQQWLARHGVFYLFLIAPSKMSIYPEMLPDSLSRIHDFNRLDQLVHYLNSHSKFRIIDPRRELRSAKARFPLYYSTGSHWNQTGAFFAYSGVMNALCPHFPQLKTRPFSEFTVEVVPVRGNDFPLMLGLENLIGDREALLTPNQPLQAWLAPLQPFQPGIRHSYSTQEQAPNLSAIMVHDSFIAGFKRLLAEHFCRVDYFWDYGFYFPVSLILQKKPAVFIDEMGERFLLDRRPANPPEVLRELAQPNHPVEAAKQND